MGVPLLKCLVHCISGLIKFLSCSLCNAAQVDDLPCMAEVDIARAVFHLRLKLSRVWHVMGSQSFNVQQLQNAIDEDAEIAQCKVLANALLSTTLTSCLSCIGLPAFFYWFRKRTAQ